MNLYHYPQAKDEIDAIITSAVNGAKWHKKRKRERIINIPCSFDIETSSFEFDGIKQASMYIWQFGLNNETVIIGRHWEDFLSLCLDLKRVLNLSPGENHLVCFIHNFAYEFGFMAQWFEWEDIFSVAQRKPIRAVSKYGIEFRDSYILSGESLSSVAKHLLTHKIEKMTGDLDYSLIRNCETELTDEELRYCINDVLIVMYYIQEKLDRGERLTTMPLTSTGYVRKYCRNATQGTKLEWANNRRRMEQLQITSDLEYEMLMRAFQGGFTHASFRHSSVTEHDVFAYDFTSSYPAVMLLWELPNSRGRMVQPKNLKEFEKYLKYYYCVFDVEFSDLMEKISCEHPLSSSRCLVLDGGFQDNGRVVYADRVVTTITNFDYEIFTKFYKWSDMKIGNMVVYTSGYLPKPLMKAILQLYKDKTELKGVTGKEQEYMSSKSLLNSIYGSTVEKINHPQYKYNPETAEWYTEEANIHESIQRYNDSTKRYLFYPYGVFIAAIARYNLFTAIYEYGKDNDYIYSDTDSVKVLHYQKHLDYIKNYNEMIMLRHKMTAEYLGIEASELSPKNIKGEPKPIGVWDKEYNHTISRFKTLGAKRYLFEIDGEIHLTCAGVHKVKARDYLCSLGDSFGHFNDGLIIPKEHSGRNIHTYLDYEMDGILFDYKGHPARFYEKSGIHLSTSDYHLSLTESYVNYIINAWEEF